MSAHARTRPVTIHDIQAHKEQGERFAMLTAYDASFAARIDRAGVECVLVGDSLGNVIQGRDTTLPVTVDDMVYHTRCVRRDRSGRRSLRRRP